MKIQDNRKGKDQDEVYRLGDVVEEGGRFYMLSYSGSKETGFGLCLVSLGSGVRKNSNTLPIESQIDSAQMQILAGTTDFRKVNATLVIE